MTLFLRDDEGGEWPVGEVPDTAAEFMALSTSAALRLTDAIYFALVESEAAARAAAARSMRQTIEYAAKVRAGVA